jgi:hypothetical protein
MSGVICDPVLNLNAFFANPLALYPAHENVVNAKSYADAEKKIDEKIKYQIEKFHSSELKKLDLEKKYEELKAKVSTESCKSCATSCCCECDCEIGQSTIFNCKCPDCDVQFMPKTSGSHAQHDFHQCDTNLLRKPKNLLSEEESTLLSIEEKIKKIRNELDLASDKHGQTCDLPYHKHNQKYEMKSLDKQEFKPWSSNCPSCHSATISRTASSKPERSRSKSANCKHERSRSKSASFKHDKPIWKSTGANDYSMTNQMRNEILTGEHQRQQKNSIRTDSKKFLNKYSTKSAGFTTTATNTDTRELYDKLIKKLSDAKVQTDKTCTNKIHYSTKPEQTSSDSKWRYTAKNDFTRTNSMVDQIRHQPNNHKPKAIKQSSPSMLKPYNFDNTGKYVMHAVEKTKKGSLYASQSGDCLHYIPDNANINKLDVGSSVKVMNSNCVIIHE